jgi:hypothetical protein
MDQGRYGQHRRNAGIVSTRGLTSNGADAPIGPCHRVAAARGSFVTLYGQSKKKPRIICHRDCCGFSAFIAAPCCFARRDASLAHGRAWAFRSQARQRRTRASGCCGHRGVVSGKSAYSSRRRACARAAARACAWVNTVGSRTDPLPEAQPAPVVARKAWATVNVPGSSRLRRCGAALGVVRGARAIACVSIWRGFIRGAV